MKKRVVAMALSLMMAASMLAGCGGSKNESADTGKGSAADAAAEEGSEEKGEMKVPEEITLYTYYAENAITEVDETLKRLKEIYPDTTVNIEHRTDSDGTVLKTRASVGELPDIFECPGTLVDVFKKSKDLVILDDAVEESGILSKFIDGSCDAKKSEDGHFYAIDSTAPQACLIYYNKDVFKNLNLEEPKNYDEFKEVVKALADSGVIPMALFGQEKWPGLMMFDIASIGQGAYEGITGLDDGTTKITDPAYEEAAKKIEELVSLGLVGKSALNTNASQAYEYLAAGQAGMLISGNWFFDEMVNKGYDNLDYFRYNPFTDAGKEEETQWHMSGGTGMPDGYGVSAKGEYAEFCSKFVMDWVYIRQVVAAENGAVTALKEEVKPLKERPECFQDYVDHIPDFKSTTKFEWSLDNREVLVALEDASELLNTGSYTAAYFMDTLKEQIPELLGE